MPSLILLFSICAEVWMIEALEDMEGALVRGQLVSDVRFADDPDMVAGTEMELEGLNEQVMRYCQKLRHEDIMFKNKKIVIRWDESSVVNIKVDGQ